MVHWSIPTNKISFATLEQRLIHHTARLLRLYLNEPIRFIIACSAESALPVYLFHATCTVLYFGLHFLSFDHMQESHVIIDLYPEDTHQRDEQIQNNWTCYAVRG